MATHNVEVAVVGAGHAGLGVAYHLGVMGLDVVVLERGQIGETWRGQRWDSFVLNTPNWMNGLPGSPYTTSDRFGFMSGSELVSSFEDYVDIHGIDVRTGLEVTSVTTSTNGGGFSVAAGTGGEIQLFEANSVVVASGMLRVPRIPAISSNLDDGILQLHAGSYRTPEALPEGAVVVVGGGQSGAQIVEDLLGAGRKVYYSISKVARVPRRYRGRDFMDWWVDMGGFWDADVDEVEDPAVIAATNPVVSGVGPVGHSISYQQLAHSGVGLLGRLERIEDGKLLTDDRVPEYLAHADAFSAKVRGEIDAYILDNQLDAGAPEDDEGDRPLAPEESVEFATSLDLEAAGVSALIWSTGFTGDFSWLKVPVTDANGMPVHHRGISAVDGLYFVGFPWLSKRQSGIIYGVDEDARRLSEHIAERPKR